MLDLDTTFFESIPGKTCIENALLGWLRHEGVQYEYLLYRSYIDISCTLSDFYRGNSDYLTYRKENNIDNIAKTIGLCDIVAENLNYTNLWDSLTIRLKSNPILIQVDTSKVNHTLVTPWRADHYILAYKYNEGIIYCLDDYPKRIIMLSKCELEHYYQNRILTFEINYTFDVNSHIDLFNQYFFAPKKQYIKYWDFEDYDIKNLRDAIGVIKISRTRMRIYLEWLAQSSPRMVCYETIDILREEEFLLNKLYLLIEYCRIKTGVINNECLTILQGVYAADEKLLVNIQKDNLK